MKKSFFVYLNNGDTSKAITKNHVMMGAILTILLTGLISSTSDVFGAKPVRGFLNASDCKLGPTSLGAFLVSCCWTEKNGNKYCQFCVFQYTGNGAEGKYEECTEKVKQNLDTPPNPPPSSPSGPAAPIQDDGVLQKPDNPNRDSVMNSPNSDERTLG